MSDQERLFSKKEIEKYLKGCKLAFGDRKPSTYMNLALDLAICELYDDEDGIEATLNCPEGPADDKIISKTEAAALLRLIARHLRAWHINQSAYVCRSDNNRVFEAYQDLKRISKRMEKDQ